MYALFDLFLDICLLRKGPQDIPSSYSLMKMTIIGYAVTSMMVLTIGIAQGAVLSALLLTVLDILLLYFAIYTALNVYGHQARLVQTLSAIFGVGTLLSAIALPLSFWLHHGSSSATPSIFASLFSFVLMIWSITIFAHILQNALSISRAIGVACAFAYLVVSILMANWILPPTPA